MAVVSRYLIGPRECKVKMGNMLKELNKVHVVLLNASLLSSG